MNPLVLHTFHEARQAKFRDLDGQEAVAQYVTLDEEYEALTQSAGLLDLSFRSRLCVAGEDRIRFLHGQVTNDVKGLNVGEGCYAALVTAKGKMVADLNVWRLPDELLLDFEPGLSPKVEERLGQYIIADDVQILAAAPHYGLLSVQGPRAAEVRQRWNPQLKLPAKTLSFVTLDDDADGAVYVVNHSRLSTGGFDVFTPTAALAKVMEALNAAAAGAGGRLCGWNAFDAARIEVGIPRFGVDMDESTLPPEAGLEARAISYSKGCYIGQEVIARVRTYGQVAKALRVLRLAPGLASLPERGDKLFKDGKEVGTVTSAVASRKANANLALAYVRREVNGLGTELVLRTGQGEGLATVVAVPGNSPS